MKRSRLNELTAQVSELIKRLAELTANPERKRKRSPAAILSSDSEEDSPAAASQHTVAKHLAKEEQKLGLT